MHKSIFNQHGAETTSDDDVNVIRRDSIVRLAMSSALLLTGAPAALY